MRFRRTLSAVAVVTAAAVAPVVMAPAADAAWWKLQMHTDDGDPGGRVRFQPNGDRVEVCDIEADGYGVELYVSRPYHNDSYRIRVGGNGNCVTRDADWPGYNLAENTYYDFDIYLTKNNRLHYWDESTWPS
ncbi:hypothetical protein ABZ215_26205 [Amycolatopsis sp. NPDC006131]|uniref:hypothetical protein n=1 Tax=Amycolatopsis sp. NPDC006131 TaxID=3156731 RepID=UPI0033AE241B